MQWWTVLQLKSKDAQTRRDAVEKLAAMEDDRAVAPLLQALESTDADVRKIALKALGKRGEQRLLRPAQQALRDPDPEVRVAACVALEGLGDNSVVGDLVPLLRDDQTAARWQAARTLGTLGWRPDGDGEQAALLVAQGKYDKAAAYGPAAIDSLMLALKDVAFYKRVQAIEALTRINDARIIKPLVGALKDPDNHVRTAVVEAIGDLGDTRGVDPLLTALKDSDGNVRAAAVAALRKIGDPRCIEKLIPLLKDGNFDVRSAVVDALGRIKDSRAVQPLMGMLKDRDRDIRQSVVTALGLQGDESAITALVLMLKDQHVPVRDAAVVALMRTNKEWAKSDYAKLAIPELQAALRDKEYWVRQAAEEVLTRLGVERQVVPEAAMGMTDSTRQARQVEVEVLLRMLKDPDRDFRQAAAEALGRVGDPKAFDPLAAVFKDEDEMVRYSAATALGRMNWKPEEPVKRAQQMVILREWDAVVEMGPAAVEPLLAAMRLRDSLLRRAVIEALGRVGDARGIPALVSSLTDSNRAVRQAAARGLTALRWKPEDDLQRAQHAVELERWEDVRELGAPAVEPLLATFREVATHPEALAPVAASLLRIMEAHAQEVSEDMLQTIVTLEAAMPTDGGAWEGGGESSPANDCSYLRELARQELARRGIET